MKETIALLIKEEEIWMIIEIAIIVAVKLSIKCLVVALHLTRLSEIFHHHHSEDNHSLGTLYLDNLIK
jgi:hypothetical protein